MVTLAYVHSNESCHMSHWTEIKIQALKELLGNKGNKEWYLRVIFNIILLSHIAIQLLQWLSPFQKQR
jgi:hypothetical protein